MPAPVAPQRWAELYDVQGLYEGDIPPGGEGRVQHYLTYAEAKLRKRVPSLGENLANGSVPIELVRFALVSSVLRVLRNPGGFISETAGEFSYRLDRAVASGQLAFTDEELADITPTTATSRPAARSVRMGLPSWRIP